MVTLTTDAERHFVVGATLKICCKITQHELSHYVEKLTFPQYYLKRQQLENIWLQMNKNQPVFCSNCPFSSAVRFLRNKLERGLKAV